MNPINHSLTGHVGTQSTLKYLKVCLLKLDLPVRVSGIFSSKEEVLVMLQLQTWLCCVSWCGAVCV
jgi:hypothetical protein